MKCPNVLHSTPTALRSMITNGHLNLGQVKRGNNSRRVGGGGYHITGLCGEDCYLKIHVYGINHIKVTYSNTILIVI
jgi:hypothetical protein